MLIGRHDNKNKIVGKNGNIGDQLIYKEKTNEERNTKTKAVEQTLTREQKSSDITSTYINIHKRATRRKHREGEKNTIVRQNANQKTHS